MTKIRLISLVTLALGIQIWVCISLSSAAIQYYYRDSLLPGISVQGINLGGLSHQAAVNKLKESIPWPKPESLLMLVDPEGQPTYICYGDIDYTLDYDATVRKAFLYSQKAATSLMDLPRAIRNKKDLPLVKSFNKDSINEILERLAAQYNVPAQNSQLSFSENNITLFQGIKGRTLDNTATIHKLIMLPLNQHELELQFKTLEPDISPADFSGINARLAMFITQFDAADRARTHNIQLASQLVNNFILPPKQVFSLNKVLGPRSKENGYLQAPVIVNNRLIPDYGGGVCQLATTLYNAVLLANLTVVERVPHSLPVAYAPGGRDATIAGDLIDFKFLNNTDYPILITSQIQQGNLLVSILGHRPGASVRLIKLETTRSITKPVRNYMEDKNLLPGQVVICRPGRNGYLLKTYEVVYQNEIIVEKRLISESEVKPEPELIAVGPKGFTKDQIVK
ncbi:VanW family protein [Desulfotomaculum sp. 1211_IL3151]|uniref:VanW family protein n=1 Tax=Desulfotomaculum sp. 1211_IL3151 TaxID=3084055 RepID=UPI002FDAF2D3